MGKGKEKENLERISREQETTGREVRERSREEAELARFLRTMAEGREEQFQELFQEIKPIAERFLAAYPGEGEGGRDYGLEAPERPTRPDLSDYWQRAYKDELAGISQDERRMMAEALDRYESQGLARTGVPARGLGVIASTGGALRSGARRALQDQLSMEQLAQHEDAVSRFRDLLNLRGQNLGIRGQDVDIARIGAGMLLGQQGQFSPLPYYGAAQSGFQSSGGTATRAGSVFGGAGSTAYNAARLPSAWSRVGGAVRAGLGIGASMFGAPGGGGWLSSRSVF